MGQDNPAGDGKPKSGTALLVGGEGFKDRRQVFRSDAAPIVFHDKE